MERSHKAHSHEGQQAFVRAARGIREGFQKKSWGEEAAFELHQEV